MASNMYKVGDCVFFETSSTTPYQIRRIEELCKASTGNVEAKVMCFYRRRDLPSSLIPLADKQILGGAEEEGDEVTSTDKEDLSEKQKHQLKHRELFLSRQVETLPATHIRGKCNIMLHNETELISSYLDKEDGFFYSLVYDPQIKTLLADKGEIRVGPRFQAEATPLLKTGESDGRDLSELEELVWDPNSSLNDQQIDNFLLIARSVGTFARSLDCTSTVRQPSLHISAAAASRDITLFHAMDLLHKHGYDMTKACADLVPSSGPVLCRDEMEEWSASEANLFREALDKYGKDFTEIRQDFLPWKSMKSMVEYYYMWKTADRYVQQKRIKAAEAENKLKQVYIPPYNKANPAQISDKMNGYDGISARPCESCYASNSSQWYSWGPAHMQCRVCASCWTYWKKYGGLKMPTRLDCNSTNDRQNQTPNQTPANSRVFKCNTAACSKLEFKSKAHFAQHLVNEHGVAVRSGSPCPVMKTRAAFCLVTTPLTRISRQICKGILDIRRAARQPFTPINIANIKQECQQRLPELMHKLRLLKTKRRGSLDRVSARLGIDIRMEKPSLLHRSGDNAQKKSAIPVPLKNAQEPVANAGQIQTTPSSRKRGCEHINGKEDGVPHKIQATGVIRPTANVKQMQPKMRGSVVNRMNGSSGGKLQAASRARKHMLSWMETPEDLLFLATEAIRKLRSKQLTVIEVKRGARKPWEKLSVKVSSATESAVVVLD